MEGRFVDEATQPVICREFPEVNYRAIDKADSLEVVTDKLHLYCDKKPFSREGLTTGLKEGFHVYGSAWRFGEQIDDLRGTARTLDDAAGIGTQMIVCPITKPMDKKTLLAGV